MGTMLDVALFEILGVHGMMIKTLVRLNISKALKVGVNAGSKVNGVF